MRPYRVLGMGNAGPGIRPAGLLLVSVLLIILLAPSPESAQPRQPNIIVIVVDALRPDHLGCYGYERATSPHIDKLAETGIRFETVITQAPWTKGSFATILTSRYPFQHGVTNWAAVMPETLVTLPELMAREGYYSMFVLNMIGHTGRFGVLRGFDEISEAGKHERNAPTTTDAAISMLRAAAEPYFMIVHYYDAHAPYYPPFAYVDRVGGGLNVDELLRIAAGDSDVADKARAVKKVLFYDGCIRYVDDQIGRIMSFVDSAGTRDETVIIVTADHGEALGERGIFGHGAEAYDDVAKVPLIINFPPRYAEPQRIDDQVRLFDLFPTILELASIEDYRPGEAVSLLPLIETGARQAPPGSFLSADVALCDCTNREVPGKICIRTAEWKIIVEPLTRLAELYNLKDDPGEHVNLWQDDLAIGDTLLGLLRRVPSCHPEGWRIALTRGETGRKFKARVRVEGDGRFRTVGRLARIEKNMLLTMAEDSTHLDLEATVGGCQMLLFGTDPKDAEVSFEITAYGEKPPEFVAIGRTGKARMGAPFTLSREDALGLPLDFETSRLSKQQGAFVWWFPGEQMARPGPAARLTPEEKKRLKALGYIQ